MTPLETLLDRIDSGSAVVGIIGLGHAGLPLAHALHRGGLRVIGFDIDDDKIEQLERGENYLEHLGAELTQRLAESESFIATSDFGRLEEVDVILVCVPTPVGRHQEPDLSFVLSSARDIGRVLRPGQLIVLESTSYPGTTREEFCPVLVEAAREAGNELQCGREFFVAFSPEREDPGQESHSIRTIPKLVGGVDDAAAEAAARLYRHGVDKVVKVKSAEVAEAAKMLENVFRAVNIALVNEFKVVLSSMNIDVWEVIEAASTKPFGFMPFFPGPGLGGHCIPIDPFYLSWRARECGEETRFIELAGQINCRMPEHVLERIAEALNEDGKPIRDSEVLVLGLAYKPNVNDTRETPAAEIIRLLAERAARVSYHDPHVPRFPKMRKYRFSMDSVPLTDDALRAADCVVIVTNHDSIDWEAVGRHARLVVDTRNVMAAVAEPTARIVKA